MSRRIVLSSGPILVKNIRSGIPTSLYTSLLSLKDVTGTPSAVNQYVTWDSDQNKFTFTASNVDTNAISLLVDSAVSTIVDSDYINNLLGETIDAATLNTQSGSYYLDYTNFTNTPTIPAAYGDADVTTLVDSAYVNARVDTVSAGTDSATVRTIADEQIALASIGDLADVNIVGAAAGKILKYDAGGFIIAADEAVGTGLDSDLTIALIDSAYVNARVDAVSAGTDSATVRTIADEQIALADTHDSATTLAQINATVNQSYIDALDTHDSAAVQDQIDATIASTDTHDSAAVQSQIDATIALTDTHDSAAVQGQIDATVNALDTHDSAAVQGQIDATVNALDTHDSAAVQGQINATINALDTHDSAAVLGQINATVNQTFINQFDTHDSAAVQGQIDTTVNALDTHDSAAVQAQINTTVNALDTHDSAAVQGQIDTTLATDVTIGGNLIVDGYIAGPTTMTIDPATIGTDSGTLVILGNLQVEGETTTVNSTTVSISDKNIVLADSATNAAQADDAGITINGANATIQYKSTGDKWEFNKPLFHGADRVLTTADDLHDSAAVQGQIDVTVNALDTHDSAATLAQINAVVNALDTHDSAAVVGQIGLEVTKTFVDALAIDYNTLTNTPTIPAFGTDYVDSGAVNLLIASSDTHDSAAVLGQINATINQSFIDALDTHDSSAVQGQIDVTVNALDTHDSAAVLGQISASSIGDLIDVDLTGISNLQVLKWDSANSKFIAAADATAGGGGTDADTLDGQDGTHYLDYNNFTNTPTIPAFGTDYVDSAAVNLLIAAADTHDSAAVLGQINATVNQSFIDAFDTHDSAAIQGMIDATLITADTHDSAAVVGQIGLEVTKTFVDALAIDYTTLTNTPTIPSFGNDYVDSAAVNLLIAAADTHDSAAVQGQIDVTVNALDTHDSAAVLGQINATVNQAFIDQFDTHDSAAIQTMIDASDTHDSAAVLAQINSTVNQSFINALDTHDSDAIQAMIDVTISGTDMHDSAAVQGQIDASLSSFTSYDSDAVDAQIDSAVTQSFVQAFIDQTFINTFDTHDSAAVLGQINATVNALDTHDSDAVAGQINATVTQSFVQAFIDQTFIDSFDTHDSAAIQAMVDATVSTTDTHDSAAVLGQINATVNQTFINQFDTHDSAAIQAMINVTISGTDTHDSAAVLGQINSTVNQTFIDALDTHDSAAVAGQISDTLNDTVTITKHSTTDPALKLQTTVSTSNAAPIMEFVRNTDQANNGDYLGQLKFIGEDSSGTADGSGIVYAKMTGKIADATDGTEDGLLEFAVKSGGSNLILARMTGNGGGSFDLENGTDLTLSGGGNITVNGNTVLTSATDTHDSAAVVGQIGLEVTKTFVDNLNVDADTVDGLHANQFLRSDADDTTTGNLTVEGTLTTSDLITFAGDSATVINLSTAIVATASVNSVQAIEATVVSVNATSGERQVSKVLLTHDTTDTHMNEYAVVNTGSTDQFTMDADINSGNFRLKLDNISGNTLFAKSSVTYL